MNERLRCETIFPLISPKDPTINERFRHVPSNFKLDFSHSSQGCLYLVNAFHMHIRVRSIQN